MKTTMELPDAVFRETKALAARKGVSLRQVIVEALAQTLRTENESPKSKPWLKAFRDLKLDKDMTQELRRMSRRIDAECERVNPEEWK